MSGEMEIGKIGWIDITVDDAESLKDFYQAVTGWSTSNVNMGEYDDFAMTMPGSGDAAAGICHARGSNANLPNSWLIYIVVADAVAGATACTEKGGKVLVEPRPMGDAVFCVIEDPSGAVAALYQPH